MYYPYRYPYYPFYPPYFYPYRPYYPYWRRYPWYYPGWGWRAAQIDLQDYGKQPLVINLAEAAKENSFFRLTLWTGDHFQVTVMQIEPNGDVGLEVHPTTDQLIRVEEGTGTVRMGPTPTEWTIERTVAQNDIIIIPAGTWHNLINTSDQPLKLSSIYAPAEHPFGTIHHTQEEGQY